MSIIINRFNLFVENIPNIGFVFFEIFLKIFEIFHKNISPFIDSGMAVPCERIISQKGMSHGALESSNPVL